MHESTKRLLDFARRSTATTSNPISDFTALGKFLEVSSATMTNWKTRGVSKDGALLAEAKLGCPAQHILYGTSFSAFTSDTKLRGGDAAAAQSASLTRPSIADLITTLASYFLDADELTRESAAPLLSRVALRPLEANSIAAMIAAVMEASPSRAPSKSR